MGLSQSILSPPRTIVGSFVGAILAGAVCLVMPWATSDGHSIGFINALFTATSAVCVTGLIVADTGSRFSLAGQIVILTLIQLGGLGIMTFSTFFLSLGGKKRVSLREKMMIQDALNYYDTETLFQLIRNIFLFTMVFEAIGAVLLLPSMAHEVGWHNALYYAVFHSVSAFCNAGFGLFSDSLSRFRGDSLLNFTVVTLIVLGGIGFPVLYQLWRGFWKPGQVSKDRMGLSFHTKIVLRSTLFLIALVFLFIFFFERTGVLRGLSWNESFWVVFFQAVTPRTAGFNTIPIAKLREPTLILLTLAMFIGASPGGTGGGIKTTTFVVVSSSIWATIRERNQAVLFNRTLSPKVISKAFAIFFVSLCLVVFYTIFILEIDPRFSITQVFFEVVSAFGTVGLSTGITPMLSSASKLFLSILMLAGRVGPLTIVLALAHSSSSPPEIRYPEGKVMVG